MENESLERSNAENEQTPEEIKKILETSLNEGRHVDLVIENKDGKPVPTPDLFVDEIDGEIVMIAFLVEDGDVGELIPLELARIKRADLREQ